MAQRKLMNLMSIWQLEGNDNIVDEVNTIDDCDNMNTEHAPLLNDLITEEEKVRNIKRN